LGGKESISTVRGSGLRIDRKNGYYLVKSQLITAGRAQGTSLGMGTYSIMFIYIKYIVVLIYFIVEGRINTFGKEIQSSDWL
jgi:hypothetical protein